MNNVDINAMLGAAWDIQQLRDEHVDAIDKIESNRNGTPGADRIVDAAIETLSERYFEDMTKAIEALCTAMGSKTFLAEEPVTETRRLH
jgi:hypothetical protein